MVSQMTADVIWHSVQAFIAGLQNCGLFLELWRNDSLPDHITNGAQN